tara:strand:+ start:14522 stop:14743 length:222 start_codon:yes stop_codon:yes gene_type:complete
MKRKQWPRIDPKILEILEEMYPKYEYSPDLTREAWAFRGGQREVISKLRGILKSQVSGETLDPLYKRQGDSNG